MLATPQLWAWVLTFLLVLFFKKHVVLFFVCANFMQKRTIFHWYVFAIHVFHNQQLSCSTLKCHVKLNMNSTLTLNWKVCKIDPSWHFEGLSTRYSYILNYCTLCKIMVMKLIFNPRDKIYQRHLYLFIRDIYISHFSSF